MRINQSWHTRKAVAAVLLSTVTTACGEEAPTEPLPLGEIKQALFYTPCTNWGLGGCERPRVWIDRRPTPFTSWYDKDGTPWAPVEGGRWYGVSSCTALDCSIYSPSDATSTTTENKYYAVARSDLKARSDPNYLGLTPDQAMNARLMPTSASPGGTGYSAHPADVDDSADLGCAPNGASNTGITGAPDGAPRVMWGTETVTGKPESQTGFIGFAVFAGQRVIWDGAYQVNRAWYNDVKIRVCDPVNHWLVWTLSPRGDVWVRQWMVQRVYNIYSRADWRLIY